MYIKSYSVCVLSLFGRFGTQFICAAQDATMATIDLVDTGRIAHVLTAPLDFLLVLLGIDRGRVSFSAIEEDGEGVLISYQKSPYPTIAPNYPAFVGRRNYQNSLNKATAVVLTTYIYTTHTTSRSFFILKTHNLAGGARVGDAHLENIL